MVLTLVKMSLMFTVNTVAIISLRMMKKDLKVLKNTYQREHW